MPIDFKLLPQFPDDVLKGKTQEQQQEITSSLMAGMESALRMESEQLAEKIAYNRLDHSQMLAEYDSAEAIFDFLNDTAIVYLAYRMGDAIPMDHVLNSEKEQCFHQMTHQLIKHYGQEQAREMLSVLTHAVDEQLERHFPEAVARTVPRIEKRSLYEIIEATRKTGMELN